MMKKLTNQQMVNTLNLIGNITAMTLPVKVSYAISKNIKKLQGEVATYEEERQKLLTRCGKKKEDGTLDVGDNNTVGIMPEHVDEWNKGLADLSNIEVEVDIHEFSIDELANFQMSPQEIDIIEFMLKE